MWKSRKPYNFPRLLRSKLVCLLVISLIVLKKMFISSDVNNQFDGVYLQDNIAQGESDDEEGGQHNKRMVYFDINIFLNNSNQC